MSPAKDPVRQLLTAYRQADTLAAAHYKAMASARNPNSLRWDRSQAAFDRQFRQLVPWFFSFHPPFFPVTTMEENTPEYRAAHVAAPQVPCRLSDLLESTADELQLAAARFGLPDLSLVTCHTCFNGARRTHFQILAGRGSGWDKAKVSVVGATLAEAEQNFYTALAAYEARPKPVA